MINGCRNLKIGGKVIITTRDYRIVGEVSKLTKTMIVVKWGKEGKSRFNRQSGYSVGTDIWDSQNIEEAIPEVIIEVKEENRKKHLVNYFHKVGWTNIDLITLEAVYTLVKEVASKLEKDKTNV